MRTRPYLFLFLALILSGPMSTVAIAQSGGRTDPPEAAQSDDLAVDLGADRDWRFVERLKADGMYDVAARQLEGFAEQHPDDPRAARALLEAGSIYRRLDQSVAALNAFEQLLTRHSTSPEAPQALLARGELLVESDRHEDAAEAYRSLLTSFPASVEADQARLGLGEANMALGQDQEAGRLFRYLIGGRAPSPIAARAMFDLGVLSHRAGEDSTAIEYFDGVGQRYPDEVIGAFGLLRSAELLAEAEAPAAARERYEAVIGRYSDPFLQARANLGLARLDETDGDHEDAAERYRSVAERGGSPEQVQMALLGLGRTSYEAGDYREAKSAAEAYLEKYPKTPGSLRARLLVAQSDAAQGNEGAVEQLEMLSLLPAGPISYDAMRTLAGLREAGLSKEPRSGQDQGEWEAEITACRDSWSRAARLAPGPDEAAVALLEAARIAVEYGQRRALAAEIHLEAAAVASDASLSASALGGAMADCVALNDPARTDSIARRLIAEHPLSPQATEARRVLRLHERQVARDPGAVAPRLAELALEPAEDMEERRLEVARLLRAVGGDPQAAAEILAPLARGASTPIRTAQVQLELGGCYQDLALLRALDADGAADAADAWSSARRAYVAAASAAGADDTNAVARIALLRMELAEAAMPEAPARFDIDGAPILEGVGELEALELGAEPFTSLAPRLVAETESDYDRRLKSWLYWRGAEISAALELEDRISLTNEGLRLSPDKPHEMRLRYTLGQLELLSDDTEGASRQLRRVMNSEDSGEAGVAARYAMAEIQRRSRRYSAARELYEDYATAYPHSQRGQRSLLLAGDCALYAGEAEQAVADYRAVLDRYPGGAYTDDAIYRLATALMRMGRTEAARTQLTQLLSDPGNTRYAGRSLVKLAELERRAGNDSIAIDALSRLEGIDADLAVSERAAVKLAQLEIGRGNGAGALPWIEKAEAEGEDSAELAALKVSALAVDGQLQRAAAQLRLLNEGYPEDADIVAGARLDLADAQLAAEDLEGAEASYTAASGETRRADLRARADYGLGLTLTRAQRFDDALVSYKSAVRRDPTGDWAALALYKIGGILTRMGEDEDALDAYEQLAEDHPDHELAIDAMRGAATAWRRLARYDKALETYHAILENHPDAEGGEEILSNIAYCYHEMGSYEVCIGAYERVLPLLDEEGQAYAQFWIADSLEKLARYEDAAAAFLKIPYLYPNQGQLPVTAQLKAAGVYERMGSTDSAIRLYQKVISGHGRNSQWGAEAVKRLERLTAEADARS